MPENQVALATDIGEARPPADSVCVQAGFTRCAVRLLDVIGAGITICDSSGRLLYLNPAGASILGVEGALVVGRDIGEVFAPLPRLVAEVDACRSGESPEIPIRTGTGGDVLVGYRMAATAGLTDSAEDEQRVFLFQDITEFAEVRRERDHLLRVATVSQLLPTIAHEIKNPLAGIQCLAESLVHELQEDEQREDLGAILGEVERMRLVIDGLGLAGGSLLQGAGAADMSAEVGYLLRMLQPRAEQLGIELVTNVQVEQPIQVNRSILRLVLLNLVNNAMEACHAGGTISVGIRHDTELLQIRVSDTGCGMPSEQIERATELFYTTKPGGSGIGLALINQMVRRDRGDLQIVSQPGKGTQVTLQVPQAGAPAGSRS